MMERTRTECGFMLTSEQIVLTKSLIRFVHDHCCDCKWDCVDHLHMLVSAYPKEMNESIDNIMTRLRSIVEETNVV